MPVRVDPSLHAGRRSRPSRPAFSMSGTGPPVFTASGGPPRRDVAGRCVSGPRDSAPGRSARRSSLGPRIGAKDRTKAVLAQTALGRRSPRSNITAWGTISCFESWSSCWERCRSCSRLWPCLAPLFQTETAKLHGLMIPMTVQIDAITGCSPGFQPRLHP